jgi:hypothetical protein
VKLLWQSFFLVAAAAATAAGAHAGNEHPERWCQAHRGQTEYVLPVNPHEIMIYLLAKDLDWK